MAGKPSDLVPQNKSGGSSSAADSIFDNLRVGMTQLIVTTVRECNRRGNGDYVVLREEPAAVHPAVMWDQTTEAEQRRNMLTSSRLGFSFSAAGLLMPYHLGAAQFLMERGYINETTPLAGSSAGAIVSAIIACGGTMDVAMRATKLLAQNCRARGTAFRLGAVLKDTLVDLFPEDAHLRCNGRIRVAVTQILWKPRALLVDQFESKQDLINAIYASCFIPGYFDPKPATMFRNRLCVDGGLFMFTPPTSAAQTVRISAVPASVLGLPGVDISPDRNPENRAVGSGELYKWALGPASDETLDKLFELGYLDTAVWAQDNPPDKLLGVGDDFL